MKIITDTLFLDALAFLRLTKEWSLRGFSKRHYLQSIVEHLSSPSERQRLSLELQQITDEELDVLAGEPLRARV